MKHRFNPGRTVITPAAHGALNAMDIIGAMMRHLTGDWGDVCEEDRRENEFSLKEGFRLLSVYHAANGTKFWSICLAS
ncbi:MAG: hypothetical protein ABII12_00510 [Planctomycetota bacterium]